jgi:GTP-binding protein
MRISQLDYNPYVGVIGIGRIQRGRIRPNSPIVAIDREGKRRQGRLLQVLGFMGLDRREVEEAEAGDIVAINGLATLGISDTLCHPDAPEQLPVIAVDEPTISMYFKVNNSPFAGRDGKFLTSRQIRDRLQRELMHNVALKVDDTEDPDTFKVSGRGELHLSILIENMRREGFELAVSRPEVILHEADGEVQEPYEQLVVDLEESYQGSVMERLGLRKGQLRDMVPDGQGRVRMEYLIPARGLIGFQTEFRTMTAGTGLLFHVFDHYGPRLDGSIGQRINGVMISNGTGPSPAYAQFAMQERGRLLIDAGEEIYEGQIVGIHSKDNDLTVNALRAKQLTNFRASGKDDNLNLTPPVRMSLEQALEFIDDDELVEVTPKSIRLRKKQLTENDRKRASRQAA